MLIQDNYHLYYSPTDVHNGNSDKPFKKFKTSLPFSNYPFVETGWFFDDYNKRHNDSDSHLISKTIQKISSPQLLINKYKINQFEFPITNPSIINIDSIENYKSFMMKSITDSDNIRIIINTKYILIGKWGHNQCHRSQYNQQYNFPSKETQNKNHLNGIGFILFDANWNILSYVKIKNRKKSEEWDAFEDCTLFSYLSMLYFNCMAHLVAYTDATFVGAFFWTEHIVKNSTNDIVAYLKWGGSIQNKSQVLKTKRLVHIPPIKTQYRYARNLIPLIYDKQLYFQWKLEETYFIHADLHKKTNNNSITAEYAYYNKHTFSIDYDNSKEMNTLLRKKGYHQNTGFIHLRETNEYLGIGHIHYDFYRNLKWKKRYGVLWGSHYSHFFFTIQDKPPFKVKRMSTQFCFLSLFSQQNGHYDCDVIQFVMGMIESNINNVNYVLISYGINDCISSIAVLNKTFIVNMLRNVIYK